MSPRVVSRISDVGMKALSNFVPTGHITEREPPRMNVAKKLFLVHIRELPVCNKKDKKAHSFFLISASFLPLFLRGRKEEKENMVADVTTLTPFFDKHIFLSHTYRYKKTNWERAYLSYPGQFGQLAEVVEEG